jgi:hypothetical protein
MKEKYKYDSIFETLGPLDGKITGAGKYLSYTCKKK